MTDDAYAEYLKQKIEATFGLDDLTPEEQVYWDEYDRAGEEKRRLDEAWLAHMQRRREEFAHEVNTHPEAFEPYIPGISAAITELGLHFEWSTG